MKIWEYLVESIDRFDKNGKLVELGRDGWELVSVVDGNTPQFFSSNNIYYFKREIKLS